MGDLIAWSRATGVGDLMEWSNRRCEQGTVLYSVERTRYGGYPIRERASASSVRGVRADTHAGTQEVQALVGWSRRGAPELSLYSSQVTQ